MLTRFSKVSRLRLQRALSTPSFPHIEEEVLRFWETNRAFERQLELTQHCKPFTFLDGPPFATGLPHYGHIAAGTIKDIVTRYASMTGHHVPRRFGWDCHGLPIEYEVDKMLAIKTQDHFKQLGLKKYNAHCRAIVMKYSREWEHIVARFGRWVDFQNDYKTMDLSYMESVWWLLKQLFLQHRVYRAARVMPYSTACTTVLSNFEANQNYKQVQDPSLLVSFPICDDDASFLVWTTTPWTLPSNLMLALHPAQVYVKAEIRGSQYILMEKRLSFVAKLLKLEESQIKVSQRYQGSELAKTKYKPPYDFFKESFSHAFEVLAAEFVSADSGTGVVHCAPSYGEDDYNACIEHQVLKAGHIPPGLLDNDGRFDTEDEKLKDLYFKDADKVIIKDLKEKGRILHHGSITHSYPFCWRSETPLIYRAHLSWFIRIDEELKERMVRNNRKARWVPRHAQEKRFQHWLENAKDWCFSRNRYWGNPIPIWTDEDYKVVECIGSVAELKKRAAIWGDIADLHRESIDSFVISKEGKFLRRIPEVFDCWFESGAMPFASAHYPFSTQEPQFAKTFPADFIAEGLDQTRGWFYTLNVLASAVRDETPYSNLIVNGLVLAEDGKKMSKRLKNYPDPMQVASTHGADAVRLYLVNSGLSRSEPLNFSEKGVKEVVKQVLIPWHNSLRFLQQNQERLASLGKDPSLGNLNILDRWIQSRTAALVLKFKKQMESYQLYGITALVEEYLEDLSNWYIRLNRSRIKGANGPQEAKTSLALLHDALYRFTLVMAPFTPFYAEHSFQQLQALSPRSEAESVHHVQLSPLFQGLSIERPLLVQIELFQEIVQTVRMVRDKCGISLKQPLPVSGIEMQSATVLTRRPLQIDERLISYILEEVNVEELKIEENETDFVDLGVSPDFQKIREQGWEKEEMKGKVGLIEGIIAKIQRGELEGIEERFLLRTKRPKQESSEFATSDNFSLRLDTRITPELERKKEIREAATKIQQLRKEKELSFEDQIYLKVRESKSLQSLRSVGQVLKLEIEEGVEACRLELGTVAARLNGEEVRFSVCKR